MQLITGKEYHTQRSVVVLGMFDGVHIGHKVLISKGRHLADETSSPLIVSTFAQHPLSLIHPELCPRILTTLSEKAELMEKLGVDTLLVQSFDRETMNTHPADYIGKLVQRFHPTDVICGYNHSFGKNGEGTPAYLEALGPALGFRTWIVPQIKIGTEEVSSTAIRNQLEEGRPEKAAKLLGHFYSYWGSIEKDIFIPEDSNKVSLPPAHYHAALQSGSICSPALLRVGMEGGMTVSGKAACCGRARLLILSRIQKNREPFAPAFF